MARFNGGPTVPPDREDEPPRIIQARRPVLPGLAIDPRFVLVRCNAPTTEPPRSRIHDGATG